LYYEDLAKKVRVRIETPVLPVGPAHKMESYPEETVTIRKSVGDSWQTATRPYFLDGNFVQLKGGLLYQARVHRYLGNGLYDRFSRLVRSYGVSCESVQQAVELLNAHKTDAAIIDFCNACKAGKKTSLANMILNTHSDSINIHASPTGLSNLNVLMALGTVQIIEKFNAVLYVPVTDEDIARVNEGTGVATFLEGGFASVEGIEDWSDLLELDTTETVEGQYVCDQNS
jgi:hypothetical protein